MLLYVYIILLSALIVRSGGQDFFQPDMEHIREDVREHYHIDLDNKTTEKELDWYYFRMHDFDNNLVLDGLEILTAMNHIIDENYLKSKESVTTTSPPTTEGTDEEQEDPMEFYNIRERYRTQYRWNEKFEADSVTIDKLLADYDTDGDGFISYTEYIIARRKANKL